jgi:hypothetical protein
MGEQVLLRGGRPRALFAVLFPFVLLVAACSASPAKLTVEAESAPTPTVASAPATLQGPLLSEIESETLALGRDGGITVPLPDGTAFWVFGDTPIYVYRDSKWELFNFVEGSSAGNVRYEPGEPFTGTVREVVPGKTPELNGGPGQFLATPRVYMLDGSGRVCNKANGGPRAEAVRWATGAALLPDQTNILVTYLDACVISEHDFRLQGWGFAEYNWKTNEFTVEPTDVFVPKEDGSALPRAQFFGSPVVAGNTVTMYSATCCGPESNIYTTTIKADLESLSDPDSYVPHPILGLRSSLVLHVVPPSSTLPHYVMYELTGVHGEYDIYFADEPRGPWELEATGVLPRCGTSTQPCTNSIYVHPELSNRSRLAVSYYLYGYGPGIADHPDPSGQVHHIVFAQLPL